MRTSALALTALLALTGASFADGQNASEQPKLKAAPTLDITSTGSIHNSSSDAQQPRLGFQGSPWFITNMN